MKLQLHIGTTKPSFRKKVRNMPWWHKPHPGTALWTSTYTKRYTSDWYQYAISSEILRPMAGAKFWLLEPKSDVRVFTVNNMDDLIELKRRYSQELPELEGGKVELLSLWGLDFERLARDYDALHLTKNGERQTRFGLLFAQPSLWGWDCESTVWFRNVFKKIELLKEL